MIGMIRAWCIAWRSWEIGGHARDLSRSEVKLGRDK
jgi:hypothetical protein